MVVVADPILETSGGPGRLESSDESFGDEKAEGVVDRLERDRTDLGPHHVRDRIGRDVGTARDCPEDGQSLGCYLDSALAEEFSRIRAHAGRLDQIFD